MKEESGLGGEEEEGNVLRDGQMEEGDCIVDTHGYTWRWDVLIN